MVEHGTENPCVGGSSPPLGTTFFFRIFFYAMEIKPTTNEVIIITGPTASGKSQIALNLANKHKGIIINADSMQIYKEIPIITASPSLQEKQEVPHFLYNFISIKEKYDVFSWYQKVAKIIEPHLKQNTPIIVVGGTGFYISTIIGGLASIPTILEKTKNKYKNTNIKAMYKYLLQEDEEFTQKFPPTDTQRIIRAFLIKNQTGKSLSFWQKQENIKLLDCSFRIFMVTRDRNKIKENATQRFNLMLKKGALEEAKKIQNMNIPPSNLKALGLKELISYLKGEITLQQAKEKTIIKTNQYIKRQFTWFKNNPYTKNAEQIIINKI